MAATPNFTAVQPYPVHWNSATTLHTLQFLKFCQRNSKVAHTNNFQSAVPRPVSTALYKICISFDPTRSKVCYQSTCNDLTELAYTAAAWFLFLGKLCSLS